MNWIFVTFYWYLILFFLGVIFFPITKKIFNKFEDYGYSFSKTISIIFLSYSVLFLSTTKILKFNQLNVFLLIGLFFIINFFIFKKIKTNEKKLNIKLIIFEEILFFVSLFFWTYVRGQEGSIKGLEKFMDFGFINAILKSEYLPAKDIWLSGMNINYYYFGHLTGAVLTKISNIPSNITYNLILATIFSLSITNVFSFIFNFLKDTFKKDFKNSFLGGVLGIFLVNFSGNLHPIYLFTKGYNVESPIPFWQIFSNFNPENYWYPNATRFIPFTIHEFPIYSYVVADLHGHVFDIPFVLLTISLIYLLYKNIQNIKINNLIFIGFMLSINYMTNAFDGAIYFLLACFILFIGYFISYKFFAYSLIIAISFIIFNLPFSSFFSPFVSGIGVNCSPDFLVNIKKIGPFLFENNNCQISPIWMLFILWGFFLVGFAFLSIYILKIKSLLKKEINFINNAIFIICIFIFSSILIFIPEFFYIKDIYPLHFRANTMFKLGYQAFTMMAISSSIIFVFFKKIRKFNKWFSLTYFFIFYIFFIFTAIYPYYAITSYYGDLKKTPELNGQKWLEKESPEYLEIINFLNKKTNKQENIIEAQGDSYSDFNIVSSYTGLPTIAGWYVHEWLWRGKPDLIATRIPDITSIYESNDIEKTIILLKKYKIKYIILGTKEKEKYQKINLDKFDKIGKKIFETSNFNGKIYEVFPTS